MFDKKEDNTNSTPDVFRPAKGSAKVVIGHGVTTVSYTHLTLPTICSV